MKIAYCIDTLIDGGASDSILLLAEQFVLRKGVDIVIFTRKNERKRKTFIPVQELTGKLLFIKIDNGRFELIHWFRTNLAIFFNDFTQNIKRNKSIPPIIITLCQHPINIYLDFTPQEIKYSSYFVFTSRTSFDLKRYRFIKHKDLVYFGSDHNRIQPKSNYDFVKKESITFGRGSSLNKCPSDMLEIFKQIKNDKKASFLVVGGGANQEQIQDKAEKMGLKQDVILTGFVDISKWFKTLSSMDIFIYQLPEKSYSVIDATLQHAMLAGLPVVFYGPRATSELIIDKKSGFIAKNKNEFVKYAQMLMGDKELRRKIGQNARTRVITDFGIKKTIKNYYSVYRAALKVRSRVESRYRICYTIMYLVKKVLDKMNLKS